MTGWNGIGWDGLLDGSIIGMSILELGFFLDGVAEWIGLID